jgi:hypothetical protein
MKKKENYKNSEVNLDGIIIGGYLIRSPKILCMGTDS